MGISTIVKVMIMMHLKFCEYFPVKKCLTWQPLNRINWSFHGIAIQFLWKIVGNKMSASKQNQQSVEDVFENRLCYTFNWGHCQLCFAKFITVECSHVYIPRRQRTHSLLMKHKNNKSQLTPPSMIGISIFTPLHYT